MGVPATQVGYTSATTGRGDHEVHKGHVMALGLGENVDGIAARFLMWYTNHDTISYPCFAGDVTYPNIGTIDTLFCNKLTYLHKKHIYYCSPYYMFRQSTDVMNE
jgi:hypothetical protein